MCLAIHASRDVKKWGRVSTPLAGMRKRLTIKFVFWTVHAPGRPFVIEARVDMTLRMHASLGHNIHLQIHTLPIDAHEKMQVQLKISHFGALEKPIMDTCCHTYGEWLMDSSCFACLWPCYAQTRSDCTCFFFLGHYVSRGVLTTLTNGSI